MRKRNLLRRIGVQGFLVFLVTLLLPVMAMADVENLFTSTVKVSDNSPGVKQNADRSGKATVASGDTVYTVWQDGRDTPYGGDNLFIAKSTDGGKTYGPNVPVTNIRGSRNYPTIAAEGDNVYVAWHNFPSIYFARSTDGGQTFGPAFRVDTDPKIAYQGRVSMTSDKKGNVYVVWEERGDKAAVFLAKSTDHGATFNKKVRVSYDVDTWVVGLNTDVAVDDAGNVYVAWMDNYWPYAHIVVSSSTDGGASFTSHYIPDPVTNGQSLPQVTAKGDGEVLLAWQGGDLLYSHSTDKGKSFTPPRKLADKPSPGKSGVSRDPQGNIYAVWESKGYLYMNWSIDGGATFLPSVKVSDRPLHYYWNWNMQPGAPSIAVTDKGEVAVTWTDATSDVLAIYASGSLKSFVDRVPPVTSVLLDGTLGTAGWYTSPVTVTLSATDSASGVAHTEYSLDGTTWSTYTAPITVTAEGLSTIFYRSLDNAGNVEVAEHVDIRIDTESPVITIGGIQEGAIYQIGLVTVATYSAEDSVSGVKDSSAVLTGGDESGIGIFNYNVTASDIAGNTRTSTVAYTVASTLPGTMELVNHYLGSGAINKQGIAQSLGAKLRNALEAMNRGNIAAAQNVIRAFINEVTAQTGKAISQDAAAILLIAGKYLISQ